MSKFKRHAVIMVFFVCLAAAVSVLMVLAQLAWYENCGDNCPNRCDLGQEWSYSPMPPDCNWDLGFYDYADWCQTVQNSTQSSAHDCPSLSEAEQMIESGIIYRRSLGTLIPTQMMGPAIAIEPSVTPTPLMTSWWATQRALSPHGESAATDQAGWLTVTAQVRDAQTKVAPYERQVETLRPQTATAEHVRSTLTATAGHPRLTSTAAAWFATPSNAITATANSVGLTGTAIALAPSTSTTTPTSPSPTVTVAPTTTPTPRPTATATLVPLAYRLVGTPDIELPFPGDIRTCEEYQTKVPAAQRQVIHGCNDGTPTGMPMPTRELATPTPLSTATDQAGWLTVMAQVRDAQTRVAPYQRQVETLRPQTATAEHVRSTLTATAGHPRLTSTAAAWFATPSNAVTATMNSVYITATARTAITATVISTPASPEITEEVSQ